MVTNDRVDELQKWIMETRLHAAADDHFWYTEMGDCLEEPEDPAAQRELSGEAVSLPGTRERK
jgi:hypothetical protein